MALQTPLLELRAASFGYGDRVVIEPVDLVVRPGQRIGILGSNGTGKSTLLQGLAGLRQPLRGAMMCRAERVGYVPQSEHLDSIFPLAVAEVVRMGGFGRLRGARRIGEAERAEALRCLEQVGLGGLANDSFGSLSGGQRQRALVARALMTRPELCLFDEPTSSLDPAGREHIVGLVRGLATSDCAVLWVDHDPGILRRAVDEVLWIENGRAHRLSPGTLDDPVAVVRLLSGAGVEAARR